MGSLSCRLSPGESWAACPVGLGGASNGGLKKFLRWFRCSAVAERHPKRASDLLRMHSKPSLEQTQDPKSLPPIPLVPLRAKLSCIGLGS